MYDIVRAAERHDAGTGTTKVYAVIVERYLSLLAIEDLAAVLEGPDAHLVEEYE